MSTLLFQIQQWLFHYLVPKGRNSFIQDRLVTAIVSPVKLFKQKTNDLIKSQNGEATNFFLSISGMSLLSAFSTITYIAKIKSRDVLKNKHYNQAIKKEMKNELSYKFILVFYQDTSPWFGQIQPASFLAWHKSSIFRTS